MEQCQRRSSPLPEGEGQGAGKTTTRESSRLQKVRCVPFIPSDKFGLAFPRSRDQARHAMKNRTAISLSLGILAAALLNSGCVFSVGHGPDGCRPAQPTQGQQLIDLQTAHEKGALTDAEYEAAKARVLQK